ncbi:MAG: PilZ domain-containing protein [Bryobacteraceae bacterium]
MKERRIAPRTPYISRTEIAWQDGKRELKMPAMIEDRSSFGLGIAVPRPIPEGSHVRVRYQDRMIPGVVRYCVRERQGALIGFSFEREQSDGPEPSWQHFTGNQVNARL